MNDNVIDLHAKKPHWAGRCRCLQCAHEWEGVAPLGETLLECPACACHMGVPKFPFSRGEYVWRCLCGNDLMRLRPEGAYCPHCGADAG